MATITADTYLDGGTARTAGEAWTCNGGKLIVRTDSRWHANAPASMAGSLGSVTISSSLGGGYEIDGRSVRWMPFNSGTGNVPAIGTTITQGAVSGYLLGVWSSVTSAPTTVGAAMPTSGFIKFREVTGGSFSAGALSGIGASATSSDVVGWIEVVHRQSAAISVPRFGKFQVRGEWFELGTTSGVANQLVQIPTNGSATTYVPGVWIETGVGTDIYELWPALFAAAMTTTNLGTDARSKFVCMETNGAIRIGNNGTVDVGNIPSAGRKIRIPNVFGRQCVSGTDNTNSIPSSTLATRPDFTTTSAGVVDIELFATDWYLLFAQPYSVRLAGVVTFDAVNISECATALDLSNGGVGTSQSLDNSALTLTSNFAAGTVDDWLADRYTTGSSDHAARIEYCIGQTINNLRSGILTYARTTSGVATYLNTCYDITINNQLQLNGQTTIATCSGVKINDIDHCDRYVGSTNSTSGIYAVAVNTGSKDVVVDGVTFGMNGAISECHPYLGVFNASASKSVKFRNLGSRSSFISGGTNSPAYVFVSGGNNADIKVQRCYLSPTRTGAISTLNSDKNVTYDNVYGDFADTIVVASLDSVARGCGGTNTTTGQASVYGTHFWDMFVSDTNGRVVLSLNEATEGTSQYTDIVSMSATSGFTSAGNVALKKVGNEIIIEMPYFAIGHTGLSNVAPVVTGTNVTYSSGARWGNHDIYYQIDTGSGWNGTWKNLTATNLSGETLSASSGFKLKYRMVCAVASTTNMITYIMIQTDSSLEAQSGNMYPLDVNTLSLVGLPAGCDLVVLSAGTATILDQKDAVNSSVITYTYSGAHNVDVGIIKPGYIPFYIRGLSLSEVDSSIPVSLTVDRNYQ